MSENIILFTLLALLLGGIVIYNQLVRRKHLVHEAWSGIDVQLKRRHSLLPKLAATVRAYADYERETISHIIRERNQAQEPAERAEEETALSRDFRQLFALAEAYPDLKANQSYLNLQENLSEVEEQIQYARRYYNGTVRNLNVLIESFPSNLVANLFRFRQAKYFDLELVTQRESPELKL